MHDRVQGLLAAEFDAAKEYKPSAKDWLASHWHGFLSPAQMSRIRNTGECGVGVGGKTLDLEPLGWGWGGGWGRR